MSPRAACRDPDRTLDLGYPRGADFLARPRGRAGLPGGGRCARQADGELQQLIWQVRLFGFHLAELEVRQHSSVHARRSPSCWAGERAVGPDRGGAGDAAGDGLSSSAAAPTPAVGTSFRSHAAPGPRGRLRAGGYAAPDGDVRSSSTSSRCSRPVKTCDSVGADDMRDPARPGPAPARRQRPALRGDARLLRLRQGRRSRVGDVAAVRRAGATRCVGPSNDIRLTLFHGRGGALGPGGGPVTARSWRSRRLGGRPVQGHRAG